MAVRCKTCVIGTSVALLTLAAAGGWALWRTREAHQTAAPEPTSAPHSSAPRVLTAALERLHAEALAHFHGDPKNGMSRMPAVYERVVKEWKTPWFSSGELDRDEPIPFAQDMLRIHKQSVKEFLTPSPEPTPEAALQTYAITWDEKKYDRNKKVFEAKSVDLIGLLKNPTPVVYVSEKIKERGDEPPMRALDEFEFAGLQALEKGEDLFGRSREGVVRLLGAVRAESSCVSCHRHKKEGDLLGAFSYVLREAQYERRPWGSKRAEQK